jgi:2-polyprenyl-3-methyl-5-hydroxy-6-metoxy-1,4-benzoquinol methylase
MQAARELGCEVYGLDISPHACRIARERLGLESERVRVGELLDDIWQEARFDVVSLWDVLEHFDKPVEQIKGARRLLVDHGILLLETPDDSFFLRRLLRWITNHTGGRVRTDRYFYYEVHLAYFNPVTIRTLLGKTGFRIRSYYRAGTVRKKQIASMRHWYRPGLRWALMMLRSDFLCAVFLRNKMIITAVVNNAVLMSNK